MIIRMIVIYDEAIFPFQSSQNSWYHCTYKSIFTNQLIRTFYNDFGFQNKPKLRLNYDCKHHISQKKSLLMSKSPIVSLPWKFLPPRFVLVDSLEWNNKTRKKFLSGQCPFALKCHISTDINFQKKSEKVSNQGANCLSLWRICNKLPIISIQARKTIHSILNWYMKYANHFDRVFIWLIH